MDLRELAAEMDQFVAGKGWYGSQSAKPQTARNLALSLAVSGCGLFGPPHADSIVAGVAAATILMKSRLRITGYGRPYLKDLPFPKGRAPWELGR